MLQLGLFLPISIHVPARGTTTINKSTKIKQRFQSTFPRGERPCENKERKTNRYFNPRSREGNDSCRRCRARYLHTISIHVPARGTTLLSPPARPVIDYFNPRSREGNDFWNRMDCWSLSDFNPRSREGNDPIARSLPAWP